MLRSFRFVAMLGSLTLSACGGGGGGAGPSGSPTLGDITGTWRLTQVGIFAIPSYQRYTPSGSAEHISEILSGRLVLTGSTFEIEYTTRLAVGGGPANTHSYRSVGTYSTRYEDPRRAYTITLLRDGQSTVLTGSYGIVSNTEISINDVRGISGTISDKMVFRR